MWYPTTRARLVVLNCSVCVCPLPFDRLSHLAFLHVAEHVDVDGQFCFVGLASDPGVSQAATFAWT